MALDGYNRQQVLSFNGTVPGPLIWADWGDNLIIRKQLLHFASVRVY